MARKYRLLALGLVLVAVCLVRLVHDLPSERVVLIGFLRGETFSRGKPVSYWVERTKFHIDYGPATIRTDPDESDGTNERGAAWQALMEAGAPGARGIATLLQDGNTVVRYQAAMALGQMGPEARETLPVLIAAVRRDLALARAQEQRTPLPAAARGAYARNPAFTGLTVLREIEAAYALGPIETGFLVNALLETMAFIDDNRVRDEAWRDLNGLDPGAELAARSVAAARVDSQTLAKLQELERVHAAEAALRADSRNAPSPAILTLVETVTRTEDDWLRNRSWQDLHRFDPSARLGHDVSLAILAQTPKEGARLLAKAQALQRVRETESAYEISRKRSDAVLAFLETVARTRDDWVRSVAWHDLQLVDPDAKVSPVTLIQSLRKQPGHGPELAVKVMYLNSMRQTEALLHARIASSEKISDLIDALLRGDDVWVQNMAWRYLQAVDPLSVKVTPALTQALDDHSPQVRKVAARALERINVAGARATP